MPVVQVTSGEVLVNTGDGFRVLPPGSTVQPGSQIITSPNAVVQLVYPDGTVVPIQPSLVVSVGEVPSTVGVVQSWQTDVAVGPDGTPEPIGPEGQPVVSTIAGFPTATVLTIAGVGGAAAVVVVVASGNSKSMPTSP